MTLSMPPVLFAFPFVLFVFAATMLDNLRVFFSCFSTFPFYRYFFRYRFLPSRLSTAVQIAVPVIDTAVQRAYVSNNISM